MPRRPLRPRPGRPLTTRAAVALAAVAAAGCAGTPTAVDCDAGGDLAAALRGSWRYEATQDAPLRQQLAGTLRVDGGRCRDFTGALDVVVTAADGRAHRVAGAVVGRLVDATVVRFTVTIAGDEREHVATRTRGTLAGRWVAPTAVEGAASGSFTATAAVGP